jgi:hypothetical protein
LKQRARGKEEIWQVRFFGCSQRAGKAWRDARPSPDFFLTKFKLFAIIK